MINDRSNFAIILFIGLLIFGTVVKAGLESSDWITLNETFVNVDGDNMTGSLGVQIIDVRSTDSLTILFNKAVVEDFESQYDNHRGEDLEIGSISTYWAYYDNVGGDEQFTLQMGETEGNEWQGGTSVGHFIDDDDNTYWYTIYRRVRKDYSANPIHGNVTKNDWWQYSVYNITGGGDYGCFHTVGDPTGNAIAVHAIVNGYLVVADNLDITPIMAVENEVWYTIRITTIEPNEWNLTVNGVTYGPFETYSGVGWNYNPDYGFALGDLGLGTFALNPADTCEFYIDNVTNSWEGRGNITISRVPTVVNGQPITYDYPAFYIDFGMNELFMNGYYWGVRYG